MEVKAEEVDPRVGQEGRLRVLAVGAMDGENEPIDEDMI